PWVQVQPWINGPSGRAQQYQGPVWIARSALGRLDSPNGLPAWKSFPLQLSQASAPVNAELVTYSATELNALGDGNVALDDKGVSWWRLELGTGSGQSAMGWVCGAKPGSSATHPGTHWASPWAWPGFDIVDATGINLTDAFKRNLSVTGSADPKEQKAFAPSTEAVGNSALLAKLQQTVSRLPSSSGAKNEQGRDGSVVVTAVSLRQALGRRWLASDLGHVILKYESEWGGGTGRWEALTPLMRNAAENWKCELERIRKLQWWDSVKGKVEGFPSSPVVNHIHPVALVGNFKTSCTCINIDAFCEKYKILHATEFGWFDAHGSHQSIKPLNHESENNLKSLLTEMMRQYPSIFSECKTSYLAYMLSTARVESYDWRHGIFFGSFTESISYDDAEANYGCGPTATPRHKARAIGNENTAIGDGYKYRGRGLVQLTFKRAYRKFSGVAGTDLVQNPDKVLELPLAVQIMLLGMRDGTFAGPKLSDFLDSPSPDYIGARGIINGEDKASQFAFYARKFEQLIKETR
ncbi:hypothetical protein J2784_003093, partial [Paraburkholderia terricola]|nr:hypothetical protein [Paraburkholderia terricola]